MPNSKALMSEDVRSMARGYTRMAMRTLAAIANSRKASDNARVTACGMLLDRGWGRAQQDISTKSEITVIIRKLAEMDAEPLTIEHEPQSPAEALSPADLFGDLATPGEPGQEE